MHFFDHTINRGDGNHMSFALTCRMGFSANSWTHAHRNTLTKQPCWDYSVQTISLNESLIHHKVWGHVWWDKIRVSKWQLCWRGSVWMSALTATAEDKNVLRKCCPGPHLQPGCPPANARENTGSFVEVKSNSFQTSVTEGWCAPWNMEFLCSF